MLVNLKFNHLHEMATDMQGKDLHYNSNYYQFSSPISLKALTHLLSGYKSDLLITGKGLFCTEIFFIYTLFI